MSGKLVLTRVDATDPHGNEVDVEWTEREDHQRYRETVMLDDHDELTRALDLLTAAPGPGRSNEHFERLIDAAALVREAAGLDDE